MMAEHLTFCIYHLPTLAQFVFIRDAPSAAAEHELKSLSVPIDHLAASKYTIPIFSAPYLQADVYSVAQGGLPERQPGEEAHPVGKLKLWFVEAGGVAFRDAIEKARLMWQHNRQQQLDQDALRTCSHSRCGLKDSPVWASRLTSIVLLPAFPSCIRATGKLSMQKQSEYPYGPMCCGQHSGALLKSLPDTQGPVRMSESVQGDGDQIGCLDRRFYFGVILGAIHPPRQGRQHSKMLDRSRV